MAKPANTSTQTGSISMEFILLIGLVGLVAGAALLAYGGTLVDTFKASDETMEASSIGARSH